MSKHLFYWKDLHFKQVLILHLPLLFLLHSISLLSLTISSNQYLLHQLLSLKVSCLYLYLFCLHLLTLLTSDFSFLLIFIPFILYFSLFFVQDSLYHELSILFFPFLLLNFSRVFNLKSYTLLLDIYLQHTKAFLLDSYKYLQVKLCSYGRSNILQIDCPIFLLFSTSLSKVS